MVATAVGLLVREGGARVVSEVVMAADTGGGSVRSLTLTAGEMLVAGA